MIFREKDNKLYSITIDVPDEDSFIATQNTENVHYVKIDESALPDNPYPVDAEYMYDENGNIALDIERMLEFYKKDTVDNINMIRDLYISQGFEWTQTKTDENGNTVSNTYHFGLLQSDINGLLSLAVSVLLGASENLYFVTMDNITVFLTPDEVKDLALTAERTAAGIIYKARYYKDKILASNTFDEAFQVLSEMQSDPDLQQQG